MNFCLRLTILYVFLSSSCLVIDSFTCPRRPVRETRGSTAQPRPSRNDDVSGHFRLRSVLDETTGDPVPQRGGWNSRSSQYLATCIPGLSTVLAQELVELNCRDVLPTSRSGVTFRADLPTALGVLLWTRTAHKVLEFLCEGHSIVDRDSLMSFVRDSVNVKDLLGDGRGGLLSLSVQVVMTGDFGRSRLSSGRAPTDLTHSKFTALSIKNALCDAVRELRGDRPDVDVDNPDVPLVAFVRGETVSLYRQLHVGSLHRRGYRSGSAIHKAAMKESLAAGLLRSAGWDDQVRIQREESTLGREIPRLVLVDPMAGSGTLLIEAALVAASVAPGLMRLARDRVDGEIVMPGQRLPPVLRWKHQTDDDGTPSDIWKALLVEASEEAKRGVSWLRSSRSILFLANDCHPGALDLLEESLAGVDEVAPGLSSNFEIHQHDCEDWVPGQLFPAESDEVGTARVRTMVVCNPPWGERLSEDMHISWESLRKFLRETCPPGSEAWILSGNAAATKHLGLKRSAAVPLQTGQQNLRWIQYLIRDKSASNDVPELSVRDAVTARPEKLRLRSAKGVGGRSSTNDRSRGNQAKPRGLKPARQPKAKSNAAARPSNLENEWLL